MTPRSDPALDWLATRVSPRACLLVAVLGLADAVAAQPSGGLEAASIEDWTALTEPLLSSIEEEEARNGPMSPNLVDMLVRLGLTYQEYDEHALAVAVLDRALYLKRVNDGLFGLDQAPLVQRLLDSEQKIGRAANAEELEERLLELARRHRGDPRTASILRDAAERELDYYDSYRRGEIPPVLSINGSYSTQQAAATSLRRAQWHFNEAIAALARDVGEHREELTELEEELTRTYYSQVVNRRRGNEFEAGFAYGGGLFSYQRRVGYARVGSPTLGEYAQALVELADWQLLFSRNGTAVKRYEEVYGLLVKYGVPAATIEQIFPQDTPLFLPTFVPSPLQAAAVEGSTGYVDVDFEVAKYGQPRRVTVVDASGYDADAASKEVASLIGRARFRPNPLADGATEYRLRYSLADGSLTPRL
jgi:hypothetical protein